MEEPYTEGVASHGGPESCVGRREAAGEALTGVQGYAQAGYGATKDTPGCQRCFRVNHPKQEPSALVAHAGIRAGGAG